MYQAVPSVHPLPIFVCLHPLQELQVKEDEPVVKLIQLQTHSNIRSIHLPWSVDTKWSRVVHAIS